MVVSNWKEQMDPGEKEEEVPIFRRSNWPTLKLCPFFFPFSLSLSLHRWQQSVNDSSLSMIGDPKFHHHHQMRTREGQSAKQKAMVIIELDNARLSSAQRSKKIQLPPSHHHHHHCYHFNYHTFALLIAENDCGRLAERNKLNERKRC